MHPRNILALAVGGLLLGCGLNQEGVPPPENKIAFPASALLDPSPAGRWLYVTNSNSDLRYNDGTLVAVDTQSAEDDRADGRGPVPEGSDNQVAWVDCKQIDHIDPNSPDNAGHCCWDLLDRNILNCDERRYVQASATVRIGSFASSMVMQLPRGSCNEPPLPDDAQMRPCPIGCNGPNRFAERLYIGVRGNSSVTWVDVTHDDGGVQFHCTTPVESPPTCGASHQVARAERSNVAASTLLPDEPYAMTLDPASQLLYVGHLKGDIGHPGSGGISLLDVSSDPPRLAYPLGSIFPPDGNGFFGVTSLTLDGGTVYASSRYVPRVGAVVHTNPVAGCGPGDQLALIPTGETFDTALGGSEIRGIEFVPDAERAFVLQRNPPALVGFRRDTRIPSEVIETCSSPTFLQSFNPAGQGVRLFITCFESGQVYVVDPYVPRLIDVIEVGRGPAGLVFKNNPERAYVVGFGENNISVVDLQPGSPTELHVIQRLGYPSSVPR